MLKRLFKLFVHHATIITGKEIQFFRFLMIHDECANKKSGKLIFHAEFAWRNKKLCFSILGWVGAAPAQGLPPRRPRAGPPGGPRARPQWAAAERGTTRL